MYQTMLWSSLQSADFGQHKLMISSGLYFWEDDTSKDLIEEP